MSLVSVGNYIVLDFGGRFFRVAYVNIKKSETILDHEAHELLEKRRARNRTLSIAPTKTQSEKLVETVASVGEHEGISATVCSPNKGTLKLREIRSNKKFSLFT